MTYNRVRAPGARPAATPKAEHGRVAPGIGGYLFVLFAAGVFLAGCGEGGRGPVGAVVGHGDAHEDEAHEEIVEFSQAEAGAAGVILAKVEAGTLNEELRLPAEVRLDPDRVARVSAPISGVVSTVLASEGDQVRRGQTLAVLSSRELAELKSDYLDTVPREDLARAEAQRAERLWESRAISEASLEAARSTFSRATAAREAAETKLHAIDIDHDVIDRLIDAEDGSRSLYSLTTPIAGQVIQRLPALGEAVGSGENAEAPLFTVVDASVVWVDIAIYRQDIGKIALGTNAELFDERGARLASGEISFISPIIDPASRTTTARVIVENGDGALRPGQFATAQLEVGASSSALRIPIDAVQTIDGATTVFVPHEHGFAVRTVTAGRTANGMVEIVDGLAEGDEYVATGAFTLKAELEKSAFGDGHAH